MIYWVGRRGEYRNNRPLQGGLFIRRKHYLREQSVLIMSKQSRRRVVGYGLQQLGSVVLERPARTHARVLVVGRSPPRLHSFIKTAGALGFGRCLFRGRGMSSNKQWNPYEGPAPCAAGAASSISLAGRPDPRWDTANEQLPPSKSRCSPAPVLETHGREAHRIFSSF